MASLLEPGTPYNPGDVWLLMARHGATEAEQGPTRLIPRPARVNAARYAERPKFRFTLMGYILPKRATDCRVQGGRVVIDAHRGRLSGGAPRRNGASIQ